MTLPVMHSQSGLDLPVTLEMGATILGLGFVVLTIITYDIYRQHYAGEV